MRDDSEITKGLKSTKYGLQTKRRHLQENNSKGADLIAKQQLKVITWQPNSGQIKWVTSPDA